MGVKTLDPIFLATEVIGKLCDARLKFLCGLKTWPIFGQGWASRVEHVRVEAKKMALRIGVAIPAPPQGQETASPKDTKIRSTPAGKGTITATIGTVGAAIGQAKDALEPLTGHSALVDNLFTALTVGGVVLTIAGIAVVAYQQIRNREALA